MEKIIYRKTLDVHKNGIQFTLQGFETADKLSRCVEINLTASGDTYELPLEGVVALMYITTPDAEEPSIEECTIKDNTIVYDVTPIVEEGIAELQLKLIGTNYDGARAVLVAPRFAIEVEQSNAEDESAEQTTSYTALENAAAKASAVYHSRLLRVEFDELCVFRAFYADGTVYESDELRRLLLQQHTDVNLATMVTDGIAKISADDVANVLEERFSEMMHTAEYTDSLANVFTKPTFVRWDAETQNTPYKAGLTEITEGFALAFGDNLNHTAIVWTLADETSTTYIRRVINGETKAWNTYLTEQGGTITGLLKVKKDWATLSLADKNSNRVGILEKNPTTHHVSLYSKKVKETTSESDQYNMLQIAPETTALEDSVKLHHAVVGSKKDYRIYGQHNLPCPAQIYSDSYLGDGKSGEKNPNKLSFPFVPKVVLVTYEGGVVTFVNGKGSAKYDDLVSWFSINVTWDNENKSVSWYSSRFSDAKTIQLNIEGREYHYIAIG